MKNPSLLLLLACCMLCGHAWGKAVDLQETEGVTPIEELQIGGEETGLNSAGELCLYKTKIFTIDVRKIANRFNGINITSPDGKYVYFLSLCSPIVCAFGTNQTGANATAAGCQYIPNQQAFVKIGSSASFEWHIVNTTYFYVLYTGGDSYFHGQSRSLKVGFKQDNNCIRKPRLEFNGETVDGTAHTYVFTVNLRLESDEEFLHLNEDVEL